MELPCHLREFILVLNEEIEAAQKNLASSAVLLSEGQFVAPVGASFRYRFNLQTPLRVPPDIDGYLVLQDRPTERLLVTIIEAEDLSVTLAAEPATVIPANEAAAHIGEYATVEGWSPGFSPAKTATLS
jgi:hypothetical protein